MNRKPWNKGLKLGPLTLEWKINISNSHKGVRAYNWKGDGASYTAKHIWISKHYGKANKCENMECKYPRINANNVVIEKPKRYEWANLSKKYKRDKSDFIQLCASCHRRWDMGIISLC